MMKTVLGGKKNRGEKRGLNGTLFIQLLKG